MANAHKYPENALGDLFSNSEADSQPRRKEKSNKVLAGARKELPKFDDSNGFLTVKNVASRYQVGVSTIWRWVDEVESFPEPIKLTPGTSRWSVQQLEKFEADAGSQREQHSKRPKLGPKKPSGGRSS